MADEPKVQWLNYVSVSTIVFAVCATLSTFKGGQFSTKTVIYQMKTSNEWAYYQAKNLRSYMHELQRDQLELAIKNPGLAPSLIDDYKGKIAAYDNKINTYQSQKRDIEKKAKSYEEEIGNAQGHSKNFGMSVIFLQIAILLASLSALMKKIYMWYSSLAMGSIGLVYFANGFLAFF
jgi:hypothetical protein